MMLQSIEYKIESFRPCFNNTVENITNNNPTNYWECLDNSATLTLTFSEVSVWEISISCESEVKLFVIGFDSGQKDYVLYENTVHFLSGKKFVNIPIKSKPLINKCQIELASVNGENLRIYSILLKSPRDEKDQATKSKPVQFALKSQSFYQSPNGNSNQKGQSHNNGLKQTNLFGKKIESVQKEKSFNKIIDDPESIQEQRKLMENIQNNRQRTLRSYTCKQKTPVSSYQNLFGGEACEQIIVCCKEESQEIKTAIEDLCGVLGLCYLQDVDEGVTHVVYDGWDSQVIEDSKKNGVKIVKKQWLLDCIKHRKSLSPLEYLRLC